MLDSLRGVYAMASHPHPSTPQDSQWKNKNYRARRQMTGQTESTPGNDGIFTFCPLGRLQDQLMPKLEFN